VETPKDIKEVKDWDTALNSDVSGAINILKRYLPGQIRISWSSGCLAHLRRTGLPGKNQAINVSQ